VCSAMIDDGSLTPNSRNARNRIRITTTGIASEIEEIIIDANAVDAHDAFPQSNQGFFFRVLAAR